MPEPLLQLRTRSIERECHIDLQGELDMSTVPSLLAAAQMLLASGPRQLTVDTGNLSFVDLRGFTALLRVQDAAARCGCRLQVRNPSTGLRRLAALTGNAHIPGIDDMPANTRRPASLAPERESDRGD